MKDTEKAGKVCSRGRPRAGEEGHDSMDATTEVKEWSWALQHVVKVHDAHVHMRGSRHGCQHG